MTNNMKAEREFNLLFVNLLERESSSGQNSRSYPPNEHSFHHTMLSYTLQFLLSSPYVIESSVNKNGNK